MRRFDHAMFVAILAAPAAASAAGTSPLTPFVMTGNQYTQDFNTLAAAGTSQLLPAGFQIVEEGSGAAADGRYVAGTGSDNAGGLYSFGSAAGTDRALGSIASGTVAPNLFGGIFTNGQGATITGLAFDYVGEQWRSGSASPDALTFEYSTDATSLGTGTWTRVAGLDFAALVTSAAGVLDGNLPANQRAIGSMIGGLSIGSGGNFGFRWTDTDSTGTDNGLAVDNLRITATLAGSAGAVPEPATWVAMALGFGAIGGALRRSRPKLRAAI